MTESRKRKRMSDELSEKIGDFEGCLGRMQNIELQLNNFIASSSVKMNKMNQDEVRRFVADLIEQSILQNNAIHCLLGRLVEAEEVMTTQPEKRDEVFPYADAAKKPVSKPTLRSRSSSRKRGDKIVALVYSVENLDRERYY